MTRHNPSSQKCGPAFDDHHWERKYLTPRGMLVAVNCSACGITPLGWLGQQKVVGDLKPYGDGSLWRGERTS